MADAVLTVAVLTYRRPLLLKELLPQLQEQINAVSRESGRFTGHLLVVDNDPDASAREVAEGFDSEVRYCIEMIPGISAARNRALDEATGSRLLAFIDDDERPAADWLAQLLLVWSQTEPAAVAGRVVPEFETPPDSWIVAGRFFDRRSLPTGTEIAVAAAGNILLDMRQVRIHGVRFDGRLGLSGGEDTLFTRALVAKGARIVWCNESVVVDRVPLSRMNKKWALSRAWSHGNTAGFVSIELAGTPWRRRQRRITVGLGGFIRVVAGAGRHLCGHMTRSVKHRALGQRLIRKGGGMLAAAAGRTYQEYRR